MANMSYCRFQNTLRDLADCQRALDDGALDTTGHDALSAEEREAAEDLIKRCKQIAEEYT